MTQTLRTPDDLAVILGTTKEHVMALRRQHDWPCVKVGRKFRFTEDHVAQIIAAQSAKTQSKAKPTPVTGQTARSAARQRRA